MAWVLDEGVDECEVESGLKKVPIYLTSVDGHTV